MTDLPNNPILIRKELDIVKLIAFVRANAHRTRFEINEQLVTMVLERLEALAQDHPGCIVFEVVRADGATIQLWAASGALVGAVIGFVQGGPVGAVIGGVVGACVGAAAAHIRIRLELYGSPTPPLLTIA